MFKHGFLTLTGIRHAVIALGVCVLALTAAPAAFAAAGVTGTTVCSGTIDSDSQIPTNLTVPPGATCDLEGTTVDGNVSVGAGAIFILSGAGDRRGRAVIMGNFSSAGAAEVSFAAASVNGNARIVGTSGSADAAFCHHGTSVCINESDFGQNLAITGTNPGNVEFIAEGQVPDVADFTIAGNLSCSGNAGIVDNGTPPFVLGNASGQCAGL